MNGLGRFLPVATALGFCLLACSPATNVPADGPWRAWLDSPGGELRFGLDLSVGDSPVATVSNGSEAVAVERVEWDGSELVLGFDRYDSEIRASLSADGARLDGLWRRTSGPDGKRSELAFHATAGADRRLLDDGTPPAGDTAIDGRWAADFESEDDTAVGVFASSADGTVEGTFLTTKGDYRYLAGRFDGERLRLAVFDGAHAFLFDARLQPDGTLAGDFWSRDSWHETWTAVRDEQARLPDPADEIRWIGGRELSKVVYPDLDGNPRSLADPEFGGRVRLLEIFGSWCPNCNDATEYLVELDRRYRDRGLAILGLAFEMTGDFERDAAQVRTYAEYHGIEYPLLIAGLANKAEASKAFPLIERVKSFPTTIFLDASGSVRAVYSGWSGPATGDAHTRLRERFESLIEQLLSEGEPA